MSRIFDTHVHIDKYAAPEPKRLLDSMDKHHIDKVALLAEDPEYTMEKDLDKCREYNDARLKRLKEWCDHSDGRLVPIYYINPVERDAMQQAEKAVDAGCAGFKVICETHYPGDERAMPVYQRIADLGKSILFHSGILWDWGDNGNYNRPCNFECLMGVSNIKFALAHVSWPWTDECLSVYGKFTNLWDHPSFRNQFMHIDLTPGTPMCYRQDVLNTIHDVDYWGIRDRMLFGSDAFTGTFDGAFIADWAKNDTEMLLKAGYDQETVDKVLYDNAMAFWGLKD
ncbi:MAG: amidohydrolase family protein [Clostridia bacterium]|nr:amidohydrolase family protein [Clostridia bacterium]